MKNLLFFTLFILFLIFTSLVKNTTRLVDKKIIKLNKDIKILNVALNEAELEYAYLTSPKILIKLSNQYLDSNLSHYEKKNIQYLNLLTFKEIKN